MSRHTVYNDTATVIVIGYDRPLHEIFVHVEDLTESLEEEANTNYDFYIAEVPSLSKQAKPLPLDKAIRLAWDRVTEHGSVSETIKHSVSTCLIKEAHTSYFNLWSRSVDWTKGIPM